MNIRELIGYDRVPEAIEELLIITSKMPNVIRNEVYLLKGRYNSYLDRKSKRMIREDDETEKNMVKNDIIDLFSKVESYIDEGVAELKAYCHSVLIKDKQVIFINRNKFKVLLKESIQSDGAKLIFVKGKPRNGMSYLEHYLIQLCKENRILQLVLINIGLENENSGYEAYKLAKLLAGRLHLELDMDNLENSHFKFTVFLDKLRDRLDNHNLIPIVYIHDFHKIISGLELYNSFLYQIANQFRNFPKVIFIVAGLDPKNTISDWHNLRYYCPVCELEDLSIEMIKQCLREIYNEYDEKIHSLLHQHLSEDQYIEEMFQKFERDSINPLDISSVGPSIAEHLDLLNQH